MKKILLLMAIILSAVSASASDKYTRDVNVLPPAAQTVVKNNFKSGISHIKIEKDLGRVSEYDVVLTDGTEITFDHSGNWKEVEMRRNSSVPSAFVPASIETYVKENQKNVKINGIERKKSGYTVELSNGVEMKFNAQGQFVKYDN